MKKHNLEDQIIAARPHAERTPSPFTVQVMNKIKQHATFAQVIRKTNSNDNLSKRTLFMKKLTISRKGMIFAAIAILLAGAVVTGYALRQDTANELAKVDQSQDERTKEPAAEPKTDPGLRVAEGYLLVPEWGVKIPLSASDAGAYYELDTSIEQPASNPTNFIVYTKEADALTSPIGVSCKGEYVAYMLRLPKDDPRWQPSTDATDGNVSPLFGIRTIVGDYQYAVSTKKQYGPQCWATSAKDADYQVDEATAQKFNDIARAFAADFKNIQAQ